MGHEPPKLIVFSSILIFFILLTENSVVEGVSESASAMKQILDEVFQQYDKGFRPYYGEKPTRVGVTAYILSVESVDEFNMDFTFNFYFRQTWDDPRLAFRSVSQSRGRAHHVKNSIQLDNERSKKIWRPDTFFVNDKTSRVHEVTVTNEFVRIQSNGTVLLSDRYTVKATCKMDLRHFPFDKQLCALEIGSFGTTMDDTMYHWAHGNESLGVSDEVSPPGFKVTGHKIEAVEMSLKSEGNYSRLTMGLELGRASGYYLLRCYVPMATFVIISLLTLLFANPFLEPLVHVITISFLILQSQEAWISKLPMVSYFNSIFIYFFICLAHLLLALFVSLAAAYRHLRQTQRGDSVCVICKPLTELDDYHRGTNDRRRSPPKPKRTCTAGSVIFYFFKLLVIGGFVASNIGYWLFHRTLTHTANQKLLGSESLEY